MKTFYEAIKTICIAMNDDPNECEAVIDRQEKGKSIIKEVCKSPEAHFVAIALMTNISMVNFEFSEFVICIKNAIAQGVLIGMEMERSDDAT